MRNCVALPSNNSHTIQFTAHLQTATVLGEVQHNFLTELLTLTRMASLLLPYTCVLHDKFMNNVNKIEFDNN